MNFFVAIVDDDEICLMMHKRIIEITGFHDDPQVFSSIAKVLAFFAGINDQNIPILLFLDINMPEPDGWDLLRIIQQDSPDRAIYIVILSSSVDQSDKDKGYSFPKVIGFVEKPFTRDALHKIKQSLTWLGPD